jgi:hypothetical protein
LIRFAGGHRFRHPAAHERPVRLFLIGYRTEGHHFMASLFEFRNEGIR